MIQGRMDAILNDQIRRAKKQKHEAQTEADKENIPVQVDGKAAQRNNEKSPAGVDLVNEANEDESDDEFCDAEDNEDDFDDDEDVFEDAEDDQDDQDVPSQVEYSNVAGYKSLPKDAQKEIEPTARQTVALEEKALLDPELKDDALKLSNEMENWMESSSVIRVAEKIENEKRSLIKSNNANNGNVLDDQGAVEPPNTSTDQPRTQAIRDDDDLSDVDNAEVEAMILTPEEVRLKTQVWYNSNKTYLEEMEIKRMVERDKGINPLSRKEKNNKKKRAQPASTPAEAAKQLVAAVIVSKEVNHAVFDDMFESPESIAKIKTADELRKAQRGDEESPPEYEVVEEPGDVPPTKSSTPKDNNEDDDDDDDEVYPDDMDDEERVVREGRARYYGSDNDDYDDVFDYDTYD